MGRYDRSVSLTDQSGDPINSGNPLPTTSSGGGGGGGTSQADKSAFAEGSGIGTPIMGVVNENLAAPVGEDKAAAVRITPNRALHGNLRDNDGNELGIASSPLRIDPTGDTPQPISGTVVVTDGGGSITIDGTVAATQSGSWTVAATQSGSWSVSITGSVTVASLNTADYDTGAGTVTQAMVGIALPASGGPVAGGTSTNPIRTDPTGTTAQPITDGGGSITVDGSVSITGSVTVTGTVAATQSGTWNVGLNAGSNTIGIVDQGVGGVSAWKVDGSGVTQPVSGTVSVSGTVTVSGTVAATQSGSWTVTANAGTGTFTVDQVDTASLDYDSGAGTVNQTVVGIALPGSGGPVAGGTATNPLRTDPTGTTAQPITDNGGSLTVDGSVSISGSVTVTGTVAATQSGGWTVTANAGTGIFAVQSEVQLDYDSGAGSQSLSVFGLALPGNGGAVAGGTGTNPVRTDPTGSTAQPVTDNGGSLTVDGSVSISGSVTVTGTVAATQSGSWTVTANAGSGTFTTDQADSASLDYDSGAGTVNQTVFGVALPGAGGPVAGGTSSNPIRTDPTGTTTQPVSGTVSVSGTVTVSGTVAATQSGSWSVSGSGTFTTAQTNAATADYDSGAGTVTQVMFGVALPASGGPVAGGTATNPLRTDPTGTTAQPVTDGGGSLTVDGTVAVSGTVTVAGVAAHGASISGNPLRVGGRAVNAEVTAVTNGQTADFVTDLVGKLIVLPFANPENLLSGATGDIVDTSSTQVIAAQAASVRIYVTSLLVQNSHATVGTWVNIKDGSTTIHTVYAASGGGGARLNFSSALKGTAATALNAVCETTGANVRVSASGYKGV
jgi:hypothetical protein